MECGEIFRDEVRRLDVCSRNEASLAVARNSCSRMFVYVVNLSALVDGGQQ